MHKRLKDYFLIFLSPLLREAPDRHTGRLLILIGVFGSCLFALDFMKQIEVWRQVHTTLDAWFTPQSHALRTIFKGSYHELWRYGWWWFSNLVTLCLIPMAALWCLGSKGQRFVQYGLCSPISGFTRYYVFWYVGALSFIYIAAGLESFASYYPFYDHADRSWQDFIIWELLYLSQFFFIEFFFRGFLLMPLARRIGAHLAVFVLMVPYMMIHLPKPMLEAFASMPFGLFMGYMALRTTSIYGGALLHVAIALTLDILALTLSGRWPI